VPDPVNPDERFQRINTLLLDTPVNVMRLSAELTALQRQYQETVTSTQEHSLKIRELEEKIAKLAKPPLLHAILIGPSQRRNGAFCVAIGAQRLDVSLGPFSDTHIDPKHLTPGQEVLVTRETNVIVGVVGAGRRGESAEVRDVLTDPLTGEKDRLLVRSGGTDGVVVEMSELLLKLSPEAAEQAKARPRAGDTVLIDSLAKIALEKLPPHETGDLELEEDPKTRYEDIAGSDEKIQMIKDVIELPYLQRARFKKYGLDRPRGILLYGPPGCGKTMIGAAAANGLKESIGSQLDTWIARSELLQSLPPERAEETAALEAILPTATWSRASGSPGRRARARVCSGKSSAERENRCCAAGSACTTGGFSNRSSRRLAQRCATIRQTARRSRLPTPTCR
jgi:ATP-dependent 26S proteasome regulatory subunit